MNDPTPYPIPSNWAWTTLGNIAEIVRIQVRPQLKPKEKFNYLSIENVEASSGELVNFAPSLGEKIKSAKIAFTTNDILYSKLRPYLNKVHLPTFDGISATDLIPVKPLIGIQREYLGYFLRTRLVVEYANQKTRGIQLPRLPVNDLLKLPVPVAPIPEQGRIVRKIERALVEIRTAKLALQKVPDIIKQFRRSVFAKAFRGELIERDPYGESADKLLEKISQERRKKWEGDIRAKGKDPSRYHYEEPEPVHGRGNAQLPSGWKWARVSQIGEVRLGRQRSPKNRPSKYPRKYVRAANVLEDSFDLSDVKEMDFKPHEFETFKLREGDVLLSEGSGTVEQSNRTLGTCAVWDGRIPDCCFQNTLIRVRSEHVLPRYFLHAFTYARHKGDFANLAKGIGIAHLGAQRLAAYYIPLSPASEQLRIVERIDSTQLILRNCKASVERILRNSSQLKQLVLTNAFSGELVPQNPDDESASVLLERIRANRTAMGKQGESQTIMEIASQA